MLVLSLPESVPEGIRAWLLPLDLATPIEDADWNLLSEEERSRAERFHHHADCVRMAATRAALRCQLGERLGCEPSSLCFELGPNDKPRLKQKSTPAFNVSHSGEYALIAVSAVPFVASLGIDIEQQVTGLEFENLAEYAFTSVEREFLKQCNESSDKSLGLHYESTFFLNWVAKEAVLKAVGVGISEHLQAVSIHTLNNGQWVVEHENTDWPPLHVCRLKAPQGYSAAIAWQVRER
ncbi:MAG: 4'-phosphopantetheinyl transferase superfamily protein [Nitrosospira sp.]|nr:4'-phosphopantetheinyl transferase superfamily protein [Nitrosospira sp.]